jgi:hypothetical protein
MAWDFLENRINFDFFFSYSYDLTHSLQYNMASPKFVGPDVNLANDEPIPNWEEHYVSVFYLLKGTNLKNFNHRQKTVAKKK